MAREAVLVAGARTAVGRAGRGTLKNYRAEDMAAEAVKAAWERAGNLDKAMVEDVVIGCSGPEGSQGMNVGRVVALHAGFPSSVPGMTVNRFCSSGLQTIAQSCERIIAGGADIIIAGGVETMSMVPMVGFHFSPNPGMVRDLPEIYTSMGQTAENVVVKYNISREDMDEFAYHSHMKAAKAQDAGLFDEEIVPLEVRTVTLEGENTITFDKDELIRRDTTPEALAKLRPAFTPDGQVTAGNSSPLSDGAAAVVIMSGEKATELGLTPWMRFAGYAVAGVPPEIMGIGPVEAVPKVLDRYSFKLDDLDLIELNEAFASQSLAVIRTLDLSTEILNVNGGAIALGHPLGCTGAKLTVQIMYEAKRRKSKYVMVTMCIGGGMGAAGIFENLIN
ncbi:MAG: acetyl-CoA acetyltransferase [Anaerolineae bacterium SM23_ 63]|nr:MAG: acetyl-CoA acetyltransferase [Anaerolineae bacterium SM23_ 63]HEY47542.1 thiolase family protein [Anaerolineae bacterium]